MKGIINRFYIWLLGILFVLNTMRAAAVLQKTVYKGFCISKEEIANEYGVSRKTLSKWIELLGPNFYKRYKSKRKFTFVQYTLIRLRLGFPVKGMILSKGQLVELCNTRPETLKENVLKNRWIGLSPKAYQRIDIFPPFISTRILLMMG